MQLDAVVAAWQADSCRLRVRLRVLKAVPSCFVYFLQLDAVVASLVTCIECSTFMFRVLHDGLHAVGGSGCESEAGICRVRGRLIWGYYEGTAFIHVLNALPSYYNLLHLECHFFILKSEVRESYITVREPYITGLIWGYCIHTCIERSTLILQPIAFGVSFLHSQISIDDLVL